MGVLLRQSLALRRFADAAAELPVPELPAHLSSFPRRWPFPRGDLYNWIHVLNRFDDILARVIGEYDLEHGPQTKPFARPVLIDELLTVDPSLTREECEAKVSALGFGEEGDRELVESILDFSRLLLEKCGNRSLYSSSERLNAFLNTSSLSLLQCTLRIGVCLAQRYYSRNRAGQSSHFHHTLLATHYNIELERVQKLAAPVPRPPSLPKSHDVQPFAKGKEKAHQTIPPVGHCNANNLISLTSAGAPNASEPDILLESEVGTVDWESWGNVRMSYYSRDAERARESSGIPASRGSHNHQFPSTPTPVRRHSGHAGLRAGRDSTLDESPSIATPSPIVRSDEASRGMTVLEISNAELSSRGIEGTVKEYMDTVPKESRYELLHRVRTAYALITSFETRQQLLAIRVLAITNLAYIYPEGVFQQKILFQDSDEPKRLQLPYQLAEFVHLGVAGDISASTLNQTFALGCLDALARHKSKAADVCAALNVNVNHGILMFVIRKTVADLAIGDDDDNYENDDWRDALFSLLRTLPNSGTRTPETLVSAGLIPMLVDILNLRTEKARRVYPRVMEFLDTYVHPVRDALATLAAARGFDALSGLISSEAQDAYNLVKEGKGIPEEYKTAFTDYRIPYFHQQSLRWLFKFVNHVMQHNTGGFERLLRNLIDSPPLLSALRLIIENARIFGSHVWSGCVNVMSHFIHNEPTSYAVIAEAGLSKSLLEAVMAGPISEHAKKDDDSTVSLIFDLSDPVLDPKIVIDQFVGQPKHKGSDGILPSSEAIICIPLAFGAICLNSTGLELFESCDALDRFFDIFESPAHVKCMKNDANLLRALGNSFDELIRHHPRLRNSVTGAIVRLVGRIRVVAASKAWERGLGAKLWIDDQSKKNIVGGPASAVTEIGSPFTQDLEALCNLPIPNLGDFEDTNDLPPHRYVDVVGELDVGNWNLESEEDSHGLTPMNYIFPVLRFLAAFFENQNMCTNFIEFGGVEYVLDLATLPSAPFDMHNSEVSHQLAQVVKVLAETKPHLVLPSVVWRAQKAVDRLAPFFETWHPDGFFSPLIRTTPVAGTEANEVTLKGTYFVKHLVAVQTLVDILREIYGPPSYPIRPSQHVSPFVQVNLADRYTKLVQCLGRLQAACVWEEILLQKHMPEEWNELTRFGGFPGLNELSRDTTRREPAPPSAQPPSSTATETDSVATNEAAKATANSENWTAYRNTKILRHLTSSVPLSITTFHQVFGHGLTSKRRMDPYQRQKAARVAEAMASVVVEQLQQGRDAEPKDRYSYLVVILSSFSQLVFESKCFTIHFTHVA